MRPRGLLLVYAVFFEQFLSSYGHGPCFPLVSPSEQAPFVFAMHVTRTSTIVRITPGQNRTGVRGYKVHIGENWACDVGTDAEPKYCTRYGLTESHRYTLYSQTKFASGYGKKELQGYVDTVHLNMPELTMLTVSAYKAQLLLTPAWNRTGVLRYKVRLGDQTFISSRAWDKSYIWFNNLQPETWYAMVTQIETSDGFSDPFINGYVYTPPATIPVVRQEWTEENYIRFVYAQAPSTSGVKGYAVGVVGISVWCERSYAVFTDEEDCMYSNVPAGTKFFIKCRSKFGYGWGETYLCGFVYSLPDPPASLTLTSVGRGEIEAVLTPPSGNKDLAFYRVERFHNDNAYLFNTTAGLSHIFKGLQHGSRYSFFAFSNVPGSHHGAENEDFAAAHITAGE